MQDKALEAAARAVARRNYPSGEERDFDMMWEGFEPDAQAAISAYLAQREADGFVEASTAQIANLTQQIETLAYENGTLKAIVQGWHYLAVGPDEMGDYYTQKQLIKASEPYASPALKAIAARPRGD